MNKQLRLLIVEDSEDDAILLVRELRKGGYDVAYERVDDPESMGQALDRPWDLIVADYVMPLFSGLEALKAVRAREIDLPFIVVSGNIGEDIAVEAMRAGAHDYILKTSMKRLIPAVERELREAEMRRERKAAEEALRRQAELLELAYNAILVRDLENRITFWNAGAEELYGYTREEAIGKVAGALLKTRFPVPFDEYMAKVSREGRWDGELRRTTRDGRTITVLSRHALQRGDGDGLSAVLEIDLDVTDVRRTEQQLRQAQKMEALGTLAGGIAHDFNNILAAIIGFTELVEGRVERGGRDEHDLERVMEAALRGRDLVKQMLTFSRQTDLEKKPLQMSSVIKETVRLLRAAVPTTIGIRVNIESESGFILADTTQIQQVIMNLGCNAAHAMKENGGVLDIDLSDYSVSPSKSGEGRMGPGLYMKLTVRDTGTGIDPDILEKIFDPFFTTKKIGEGTGLGLSVVHGIVEQSGGHITVESVPGRGSAFALYFPKIAGEAQDQAAGPHAIPTGSERILFVDDEEPLVEMGEEVLSELGYEVTSRTSSREALSLLQKDPSRFDLVITDQTMPGMTGLDLARQVLIIRPDMPVIICTGFSHLVDAGKAKSAGIRAFAMKPLTKAEIARTVRRVLDEQAAS